MRPGRSVVGALALLLATVPAFALPDSDPVAEITDGEATIVITRGYVDEKMKNVIEDQDLTRYIL